MLSIILFLIVLIENLDTVLTCSQNLFDKQNNIVKREAPKTIFVETQDVGGRVEVKAEEKALSYGKKVMIMTCGVPENRRIYRVLFIRFSRVTGTTLERIANWQEDVLDVNRNGSPWLRNAVYQRMKVYSSDNSDQKWIKIEIAEELLFNQKFECHVEGETNLMDPISLKGYMTMYTLVKDKKKFELPTIVEKKRKLEEKKKEEANIQAVISKIGKRQDSVEIKPAKRTQEQKADDSRLFMICGALFGAVIVISCIFGIVVKFLRGS